MLAGIRPASAQDAADKSPQLSFSFPETKPAAAYVGDEACNSCHEKNAVPYHKTAHARTSSLPSHDSIHGSFNPGSNILRTANPDLTWVMEANDKGFFQTGVLRNAPPAMNHRTERIDVVIGSGRKGQTYLYWNEDALFLLPVSFFQETGEWVNSPGFASGTANFYRPVLARCLECHASSFESRSPLKNFYNKSSLVLGITCEKCHGPGGEHVARYQSASPPTSLAESAIVNPARLPRDRQMDVCALCHAGIGKALTPPLSFVPGDVLERHLEFPKPDPKAHLDVHGSQTEMLELSRCFQSSPSMTCTTCHNVHTPQRELVEFAARCLTCHKVEDCRKFPQLGHGIDGQCIACHMPLQSSAQIIISSGNGRTMLDKVRNHQIGIYPDDQRP